MKQNRRVWTILAVCLLLVCTLALSALAQGGATEKTVYVGTYSGTDSDGTLDKPYTSLNAAIEAINAAKDANSSITDGKIIVKNDITVVGAENVTLTACKVPLEVTSADPANRSKLTLNTHTSKRILYCSSEIEFNNVIFLVSRSTYTEIWSGPSLTFGENVSTYSGTTTEAPASDYFCVRMNGANPSFTMLSGTLNVLQGGNSSGHVTGTSTIVLGGTARITHIMQCSGTSKSVASGDVTIEGNAHVTNLYINGHGTSKIDNVDITITGATVDNITYHRTADASATSNSVKLTLDNATIGSLAAKDSRVTKAELTLRNGDYSSLTTTGWTVAKSVYVNQSYTGGDGVGTYAKPYASIETAVSALNSGENAELVIVGTYKPSIVWKFPTHSTGKISVTGYDANAKIYVDAASANDKPYWDFFSAVEFHDLTIAYDHGGKSMEMFTGPELTIGTGMIFLCEDCTTTNGTITSSADGHICVRGGYREAGKCEVSRFTMLSGTLSYVQGGSRYREVGDSYITIGGTAKIVDHIQGSGTFHSVDNSHITITGGTVAQLAVGGYGQTGNNKGPAKVIESSTISITGGMVSKITAYRGATYSADVINSIDMTIGGTAVVGTMEITGVNITGTNALTINNSQSLTNGFGTFWDSITVGTGATVRVAETLSMTQKNDQDANVLTVKDGATLTLGLSNTAIPAYTKEGTGKIVLESALNIRLADVYLDQSKSLVLGDGSADGSAAKPVSSLADAYAILQDGAATIHLVGEYKITGAPGVYVFPYHNGKVTIVGTDANAKINFDTTDKTLVQFSSATELKNLQWRFAHKAGNMDIYSGPDLSVQEGVSFHCDNHGSIGENCIAIRGGYQKDSYQNEAIANKDVKITVMSGKLSYIQGGNGATATGNTTINFGGTAEVVDCIQGGGTNKNVNNSTVNISGGKIPKLYINGYGTANMNGDSNITITGGTIGAIRAGRYSKYEGSGRLDSTGKITGGVNVSISGSATVTEITLNTLTIEGTKNLTFGNDLAQELWLEIGLGAWDSLTLGEGNTVYLLSDYALEAPVTLTVKKNAVLYLDTNTNSVLPNYVSEGTGTEAGKVELFDMPSHLHRGDTWSGEKLTVLAAGGMQGTAVYGDWLLQADSSGGVSVYNLANENPGGTRIATFHLASYNGGTMPEGVEQDAYLKPGHFTNHSNQMMFGATKFDENDPFPLLYVSTGNSGGHDHTGAYVAKCSVERIKYDAATNTWSAELVQTIEFNDFDNIPDEIIDGVNVNPYKNQNLDKSNAPSEFLTKMRDPVTGKFYYISGNGYDASAGYQKVAWGWPASFVDSDPTETTAGKFYLYSARYRTYAACDAQNRNAYGNGYTNYAEENAYIITEFNMPALPTSESDPNYGKTVTLYPRDITDQFETAYKIGGTQGGTMYRGKIYYPYGFNAADNGFQIFDIADKALTATYRLGSMVPGEPEGTAIYNGSVLMSDGSKNIWKFNVLMEDIVAKDATCTEAGTIDHAICNLCDQKFSMTDHRTVLNSVEDPNKPALDHSFTNYVSNNDATCTEDGTKTAVCDRDGCNEKDTVVDTGSKLDHSFTDYKSNGDATCTADGTKTAKCDRCDETDTVKEAAHGHKLTKVAGKAATCTEEGVVEHYTCSVCKKNFSDAEGKTALSTTVIPSCHSVEKVEGKAATTTENGLKEHYGCASCGKVYADAEGKTEVTKDSLIISATSAPTDTGDDFRAWPFILLMVLSVAGVTVLVIGKKQWFRKNK